MTRRTQIRFGAAVAILFLALGMAAAPGSQADTLQSCSASCEHSCMLPQEACFAGTGNPECGGNQNCCLALYASCFNCCTWY